MKNTMPYRDVWQIAYICTHIMYSAYARHCESNAGGNGLKGDHVLLLGVQIILQPIEAAALRDT
jgi:hypothetical protein